MTVILTTVFGVLPMFLLGAFAPEIREAFDLTQSQFGLIAASFWLTNALLSIAGGRLIQRFGAALGITVSTILGVLSLIGVATAPSVPFLLGALVVGGIAVATTQPTGNLLLMGSTPVGRLGLAFGVKQASIPVAAVVSGLAVPTIGVALGWRWAFAFSCLLAVWLLLRVRVLAMPALHPPKRHEPSGHIPGLALLAGIGMAASMVGTGVSAFFVESAVDNGITSTQAGVWFAAAGAAGVAGRLIAGLVVDRRTSDTDNIGLLASLLAVGAMGFALLAIADSWWLRLIATAPAFAAGWGWNGLFHLIVSKRGSGRAAHATGVTQTGMALGGMCGPILFGFLIEHLAGGDVWFVATGLLSLGATGLLLLKRQTAGMKTGPSTTGMVTP
ncbi:MAG: MFS transporter [Dehalococcoidia bacterium]